MKKLIILLPLMCSCGYSLIQNSQLDRMTKEPAPQIQTERVEPVQQPVQAEQPQQRIQQIESFNLALDDSNVVNITPAKIAQLTDGELARLCFLLQTSVLPLSPEMRTAIISRTVAWLKEKEW